MDPLCHGVQPLEVVPGTQPPVPPFRLQATGRLVRTQTRVKHSRFPSYCPQTDMESKRVVSKARAEQFASEVGGLLCETSAKENWGVNELFSRVSRSTSSTEKESPLRSPCGSCVPPVPALVALLSCVPYFVPLALCPHSALPDQLPPVCRIFLEGLRGCSSVSVVASRCRFWGAWWEDSTQRGWRKLGWDRMGWWRWICWLQRDVGPCCDPSRRLELRQERTHAPGAMVPWCHGVRRIE